VDEVIDESAEIERDKQIGKRKKNKKKD